MCFDSDEAISPLSIDSMKESWNEYPILTDRQYLSTGGNTSTKVFGFGPDEGLQMQTTATGSCYGQITNFNFDQQTLQTTRGAMYKPEHVQKGSRCSTFTSPGNSLPLRGFSQETQASEVTVQCSNAKALLSVLSLIYVSLCRGLYSFQHLLMQPNML